MFNSIESLENAWIIADSVKYTRRINNGLHICSRASGLAFGLTNPNFSTPRGFLWSKDYYSSGTQFYLKRFGVGFDYEEDKYWDVEQAYQVLKNKHSIINRVPEIGKQLLMIDLIFAKLIQFPFLIDKLRNRGGLELIADSIHQPTNRPDFWNTNGSNGFIKCLYAAYYLLQ